MLITARQKKIASNMWNTIHESRATASKKDNIVVRRLWVAQSGGGGRGGRRKARDTEGEGCGLLDLNQLFYKIYVCYNIGQRCIKIV